MARYRRLTVLAGAVEAARRYVRNNPDKVNQFADRAWHFVDERTNGKYRRQIDGMLRKVRSTTANQAYRRH